MHIVDNMPKVLELAGLKANHTHFAKSLVPQLKGASGDPERAVFCEVGYDLRETTCFEGYVGRNDPLNDAPRNFKLVDKEKKWVKQL